MRLYWDLLIVNSLRGVFSIYVAISDGLDRNVWNSCVRETQWYLNVSIDYYVLETETDAARYVILLLDDVQLYELVRCATFTKKGLHFSQQRVSLKRIVRSFLLVALKFD